LLESSLALSKEDPEIRDCFQRCQASERGDIFRKIRGGRPG
jgi:hypothetical protein